LWCPRDGELHFTCLDASVLIGQTLRSFGSVILASATLRPADVFAASCGLDEPPTHLAHPGATEPPAILGKLSRKARKTLRELTSGAALLQVEEAREGAQPRMLQARAPWRETAYRIGIDLRVDTTFQHRVRHYATTATTVETLHGAASQPVVVFFPSYAYAESILKALETADSPLHVALQPRSVDLAAQAAWVEESLTRTDALFLVLGSSFAESIDLLGGRVTHAMVVGPALPEVNAIQRTRLSELERAGLSRNAAFRRVYQIPGMTKVNQALGRLVRAPGQQARVLLHCRRFADPSYATLLSPEYQHGARLNTDAELAAWLLG
jgi:Rad3-related DNA helicase